MIAVPLDDQSRVLLDVVDRLEREGIEYMISGSIALSAYVRLCQSMGGRVGPDGVR